MNKDAILATIIGFGIGLLITGAVLTGPSLLKSLPSLSLPQRTNTKDQIPQPAEETIVQADEAVLSISTPVNESLHQKNETVVSGVTAPGALVVITGPEAEVVTEADAKGNFTGTLALVEGKNTILATRYKNQEKTATVSIVVFYTQETL